MKRKNKAAILIAAGGALVLTLTAYLIWGKKVPKINPINPNPNPNNNPNVNPNPNVYGGGSFYGEVYGGGGSYGGGGVTLPSFSYPRFKVKTNTGAGLNVRSTPSTTGTILLSVPDGTTIFAKPSSTSGWHEYSTDGNTRTGYISSTYLIPA